jgi:hypothetical protein
MCFLHRLKVEYLIDPEGRVPNEMFNEIYEKMK